MKHYRSEGYYPGDVIDRGTYGEWEKGERLDAAGRAHRRVEEILSKHRPELLEADVVSFLRERMEAEAKKYGMDSLPA